MKWIVRNGRRYGYLNRRVGRRVESIYIGSGKATELLERIQTLVKAEQAAGAAQWQLAQGRLAAVDATVEALCNQLDALEPELRMPDHGNCKERTT